MVKVKKEALLISPKDIKPSSKEFEVIGTINPAAVRLPDGKIFLYLRVIEKLIKIEDENYFYSPRMIGRDKFKIKIDKFDKRLIKENSDLDFIFKDGTKRLTFISHFRRVILDRSGFKILSIDEKPSFFGTSHNGELGIEDPRITKIEDKYAMTYVNLSRDSNVSTSLAISKNCKNWKRKGIIFGEQDKDVVLFPEKINNKYVSFDRPEGSFQFSLPHIWIAYSNDLKSWGDLKAIDCVYEEEGSCPRNGAGPPPIKIEEGWLLIYHAVVERKEFSGKRHHYVVGAVLLDLKNPEKLIAKTDKPILSPTEEDDIWVFENKRVIFPTGLVLDENGKDLLIYSGEGDVITTVKKISLDSILKSLIK